MLFGLIEERFTHQWLLCWGFPCTSSPNREASCCTVRAHLHWAGQHSYSEGGHNCPLILVQRCFSHLKGWFKERRKWPQMIRFTSHSTTLLPLSCRWLTRGLFLPWKLFPQPPLAHSTYFGLFLECSGKRRA